MKNRMLELARRPNGMVTREDFSIEDRLVPKSAPASSTPAATTAKLVLKV